MSGKSIVSFASGKAAKSEVNSRGNWRPTISFGTCYLRRLIRGEQLNSLLAANLDCNDFVGELTRLRPR